jgi:hypothetical protein
MPTFPCAVMVLVMLAVSATAAKARCSDRPGTPDQLRADARLDGDMVLSWRALTGGTSRKNASCSTMSWSPSRQAVLLGLRREVLARCGSH